MSPSAIYTDIEATEARNHKIEDLLKAVREAAVEYERAEAASTAASSEATRALNNLNAAQRLVDVALAEIRKIAPRSSDWRNSMSR